MKYSRTDIARGFVKTLDKRGQKKAVRDLAALMLDQRMHGEIEEILEDIQVEYMKNHGVVEAHVRSAHPLSISVKKELEDRVKKSTKANKVLLTEEIDSSLLGGVVVTAPGMELDLSLRRKLDGLKRGII